MVEALDGLLGESGQDRGEVVADGQSESAAAFDDGEDGRDLGSGFRTAQMGPVAAPDGDRSHGVHGEVVG